MASTTVADCVETESGGVMLSKDRRMVILECFWETEALCRALRKATGGRDNANDHFVIRGMSARIEELACIISAAIEEEEIPTIDLKRRLHLNSADAGGLKITGGYHA